MHAIRKDVHGNFSGTIVNVPYNSLRLRESPGPSISPAQVACRYPAYLKSCAFLFKLIHLLLNKQMLPSALCAQPARTGCCSLLAVSGSQDQRYMKEKAHRGTTVPTSWWEPFSSFKEFENYCQKAHPVSTGSCMSFEVHGLHSTR